MKYNSVCWSPYDADEKCEYRDGERCTLKGECTWKRVLLTEEQEEND